jgi:hypothetical protein
MLIIFLLLLLFEKTLIYSNNSSIVREPRPPERLHFLEKYTGPNKAPYAIDLMAIPEQSEPKPVVVKPEPKLVRPFVRNVSNHFSLRRFVLKKN